MVAKKVEKMFALLLVASMVASTGSMAVSASEEVDIWAPYDETVELTTFMQGQVFAHQERGEDYYNNCWHNAWSDIFNIDVKYNWISETGEDYNTKLNLAIADGDLPDVYSVSDLEMFKNLVDAGMAMDITEVYEKYASDTTKSYMAAAPEVAETVMVDGKMYGIPALSFGDISQIKVVWIRKDWKEEQGLKDPETMDDLKEIVRVFKENYGSTFGEDMNLQSLRFIAPAWGAYPNVWVRTENGVEYGSIQPEMKDALATYAEWYAEGLLDDEFMIANGESVTQAVVAGEMGILPHYNWLAYYNGDIIKNNGNDARFEAYAIPTATGEDVKVPIDFPNEGYTVINPNCKNPEAVMKLVNFYADCNFTGNYANGTGDPEIISNIQSCAHTLSGPFRILNPQTDYNQYVNIQEALKTGDTSALLGGDLTKYESCVTYLETQDPSAIGNYMQVGDAKCAYSVSAKFIESGNYFYNALWGISPESLIQMGSTLDSILTQGFTKIICGEESLDYFDTLVEDWKKAGGDQITEDMNAFYK